MNYKEIKELLLNTEALTLNQAEEIILSWEQTPKMYETLMRNQHAHQSVQEYFTKDVVENIHEFVTRQYFVPTAKIAKKFFELDDDDISVRFIDIMSNYVIGKDCENPCAWPYLKKEFVNIMSVDVFLYIISRDLFIFDFKEDIKGSLYNSIYKKLGEEFYCYLLALNSVNTQGWLNYDEEVGEAYVAHYHLMSQHSFAQNVSEEASFRKMMIRYLVDVRREEAMLYQKGQEKNGVVFN